jgi:hypothetical protein
MLRESHPREPRGGPLVPAAGPTVSGVTARLIEPDGSVTILLLALKEIRAIHERHRELPLLVDQVKVTPLPGEAHQYLH